MTVMTFCDAFYEYPVPVYGTFCQYMGVKILYAQVRQPVESYQMVVIKKSFF
jgi:hypothetical protein